VTAFREDDGSALVETFGLAVLVLVPLAWILVAAFNVQSTAYAAASAAREAGRAYVTTPVGDDDTASARASAAARLVLDDFGVPGDVGHVRVRGSLVGGEFVTAEVDADVLLPFLPRFLSERAVHVRGTATAVVDEFR
jgi:Flp pilus assembly protein TadG